MAQLRFLYTVFLFCLIASRVSPSAEEFLSEEFDSDVFGKRTQRFAPFKYLRSIFSCNLKANGVAFRFHSTPEMNVRFLQGSTELFTFEPKNNESPLGRVYQMYTGNRSSIESLGFKPNGKFKFILHGFSNNVQSYFPLDVIGAYKTMMYIQNFYKEFPDSKICEANHSKDEEIWRKCVANETSKLAMPTEDLNIISVDWSSVAEGFSLWNYVESRKCTKEIATAVADFIQFLMQRKQIQSLDDVHLIGFSFGAHLSGMVGKILKGRTGKLVGRITGLDPALPGFVLQGGLDRSRAKFVDVYHTADGVGKMRSIGHVDIFPNSNIYNHGFAKKCQNRGLLDKAVCAHELAHQLFAFSILHPEYPIAYRCKLGWFHVKILKHTKRIRIGEYMYQRVHRGGYCFCQNMVPPNLERVLSAFVAMERLNFGFSETPIWEDLYANWRVNESEKC